MFAYFYNIIEACIEFSKGVSYINYERAISKMSNPMYQYCSYVRTGGLRFIIGWQGRWVPTDPRSQDLLNCSKGFFSGLKNGWMKCLKGVPIVKHVENSMSFNLYTLLMISLCEGIQCRLMVDPYSKNQFQLHPRTALFGHSVQNN